MRFYLNQNVFDAALDRIRFLYDEFENIVVNFSGGKDSTASLFMTKIVAEERGRLPVKVMFIDQEAEWQTVIDYNREISRLPWVDFDWLQVPFKIFNATSGDDPWLYCWEPGKEWIRDKEPDSIHENIYGTDRFARLFLRYMEHEFNKQKGCCIAGVRCEESPSRHSALTSQRTYKHVTWGNKHNKRFNQYTFYPLYDWSFRDVWKAIHQHSWPYCKIYDYMYAYGVPVNQMRVSNLTHETAIKALTYVHEVESHTWDKVTRRLSGLNTVKHMQKDFFIPRKLPWMFESWQEYRDHLLKGLITDQEIQEKMRKRFKRDEELYIEEIHEKLWKMHISCIISNDYHGTKSGVFRSNYNRYLRKSKFQTGKDKWVE